MPWSLLPHCAKGAALRTLTQESYSHPMQEQTRILSRAILQENVDIVRSICADWERGDFSSAEWAHPDIECVFADGPTPGTWIGKAGMAKGWGDFLRAWEEFRAKPEGYRELDSER